MPVTKTAKRALRGSKKKEGINLVVLSRLSHALRLAKKSPTKKNIGAGISLADRAAKKHTIHANKAARIKSRLAKLQGKSSSK